MPLRPDGVQPRVPELVYISVWQLQKRAKQQTAVLSYHCGHLNAAIRQILGATTNIAYEKFLRKLPSPGCVV
jgi:hypothetical protein